MDDSNFRIKKIEFLDGHVMYYPQINIVDKKPPRWKFWAKQYVWRGFTITKDGIMFSLDEEVGCGSSDIDACKRDIEEYKKDSKRRYDAWIEDFKRKEPKKSTILTFKK